MKKFKTYLTVLVVSFMMFSCAPSIEKLEGLIKEDINKQLSEKAKDAGIEFNIESLKLEEDGEGKYKGVLKTLEDGKEFTYNLKVEEADGGHKWEIVP